MLNRRCADALITIHRFYGEGCMRILHKDAANRRQDIHAPIQFALPNFPEQPFVILVS